MSSNKSTRGHIMQICNFVEQVLKSMNVPFNALKKFVSSSEKVEEFKTGVQELLEKLLVLNPFCSEVVKQTWFYPKGWRSANVDVQAKLLAELFRRIDLSQVDKLISKIKTPKSADGICLLPKISYLGELWGINDPYGKGYGLICEKLFGIIASSRSFHNYRDGQMSDRYIRIFADVREKLQVLETAIPGDVLVMAFNFGNLYAGWSPRAARWETLNNEQLPLITAQVACLLLIMPDRLTAWGQLFIDYPGDEWDWGAGGSWSRCPYFHFNGGNLEFDTRPSVYANGCFGSAVGFPSEC